MQDAGPTRDPIVVLIEDDQATRAACSDLLATNGFDVRATEFGEDGVRLVCEVLPDVVITDILLPDIDGRDVARLLRANPPTRVIPVIAATGEADVPGQRDAGLFAFVLHKPFAPGRLLDAVARCRRQAEAAGRG